MYVQLLSVQKNVGGGGGQGRAEGGYFLVMANGDVPLEGVTL